MIHLDVKTDFSFLKAYGSPQQVLERAKEIGATSIGIADIHGTWGHIPFYKAFKGSGIKPLFGVVLPAVKELTKDPRHETITLIAMDQKGLAEQYDYVSIASQQFYYRPRLTWDQIKKIRNNVIIVNRAVTVDENTLGRLKAPVFIGASPSYPLGLSLARATRLNVAVACSPLYPKASDLEAYRLVNAIGSARKTFDIDAVAAWMFREGEMKSKFLELGVGVEQVEAWYENSKAIADLCNAELPKAENVKPPINITLEEWCDAGATMRGIDLSKEPWRSRLAYELRLIHEKGFDDYFLLIADLIAWAKERMFVGPARGSSAGSLVCYLMGVVEVDPIKHGLMFERFIDVSRMDLPDVDIDFPDERRDEVFDYLASKYGAERVARLGTTSLFKSKSSINDVARCYSIPSWEVEELSAMMIDRSSGDARANMTILDTFETHDKAKELIKKYPKLHMAEVIEGHVRHTGKHAAGVCISNDAISRYCSIDHQKGGIAELTKYDAEVIGLMKIDALGLKTLSVLQDCCEQVGIDPKSLYNLPLDSKEAFEVFQRDKIAGVFQFEGPAVRSLMRQMGVEEFNDIVSLTSLARPGPLHCGGANEFIHRRTGQKDWDYIHPSLHDHTSHTYGTIVYQEQVMSITRDLGDMDWQDVNSLRRAMSKSLGEEFFNKYRDKFMSGTKKKGIDDEIALKIWNDMCTFGSWAFNLSHAVSYAIISYWCAYLKAHHPIEFAVAHLRRAGDGDTALRILRELHKEGYEIVPIDPHLSELNWSAKNGRIVGGLVGVKGIGPVTAEKLLEVRNEHWEQHQEEWLRFLSPAYRGKLLAPNNTPWHNLTRLHKTYADLYENLENRSGNYKPKEGPLADMFGKWGINGPLWNIQEIPDQKGEYLFIGTLKKRNLRDLNETQSLVKRGGRRIERDNLFLNLLFEDDTGDILCSINRYNYERLGKPLMEEESDGHDFLIRGRIQQDGRRKINIERITKISGVENVSAGANKDRSQAASKADGSSP